MSSNEHEPQSTPDQSKTTMLVVRLSPALKRAVEQRANEGAVSMSDWVRDLLAINTREQA